MTDNPTLNDTLSRVAKYALTPYADLSNVPDKEVEELAPFSTQFRTELSRRKHFRQASQYTYLFIEGKCYTALVHPSSKTVRVFNYPVMGDSIVIDLVVNDEEAIKATERAIPPMFMSPFNSIPRF